MKVLLITMTDRPLGLGAALAIQNSHYDLSAVIAPRRFAGRFSKLSSISKAIKRHGSHFLLGRIKESFLSRLGVVSYEWDKYNTTSKPIKSLADFAKETGVQYIITDDVNSNEIVEKVEDIGPDVIVLVNAPIIKKPLIDAAGLYVINLHRSLLPQYAGLDAIFWALYHGENEIGATVHVVTEKIDEGAIIVQRKREVKDTDNIKSLTKWYYDNGPDMVIDALAKIENKTFDPKPQDLAGRSYYSWPTRQQRKELRKRLKNQKAKN